MSLFYKSLLMLGLSSETVAKNLMAVVNNVFQSASSKRMNKFLAGLGQADQNVLGDNVLREFFKHSMQNSFVQGPSGAAHDLRLLVSNWGVNFDSIKIPVHIWHGTEDQVIPLLHSKMMAERLKNSKLWVIENEGHYSLPVTRLKEIMEPVR